MDDLDRLLELRLRRKLDVIAAAPVPIRRGRGGRMIAFAGSAPTIKRAGGVPIELWLDRLVFVKPR